MFIPAKFLALAIVIIASSGILTVRGEETAPAGPAGEAAAATTTTDKPGPTGGGGPISFGKLLSCDHGVEGDVLAMTQRHIIIKGFKYDGAGPATWIHLQKKEANEIDVRTANAATYLSAGLEGKCDNFTQFEAFDGTKDVNVFLSDDIKNYHTFGLTCYGYCNNFGYLSFTQAMANMVDPATPEQMNAKKCTPAPSRKDCLNGGEPMKNKKIPPQCDPKVNTTTTESPGDGATVLSSLSAGSTLLVAFFAVKTFQNL